MKGFFKKIWAAIKAPVYYAAIILIAGVVLFGVIDAIVRCCQGDVFGGLVQLLLILAGIPLWWMMIAALAEAAKGNNEDKK